MTEDLLGVQSSQSLVTALESADGRGAYAATRAASGELGALTLSERARALGRAILVNIDRLRHGCNQ